MALLLLLAERAPHTLTRDEIIRGIWQGRIVTDDAINKQVSKLRSALADPARPIALIETVPKVGVRLTETPISISSRRRSRAWLAIAAVAAGAGAIALYFGLSEKPLELIEGPLTATPGVEFDPALSPDGRWMAYSMRGPNDRIGRLYVRRLAEDGPQPVSAPGIDASNAAWSSYGKLAFVGRRGSECRIYVREKGALSAVAPCVGAEAGGLTWLSPHKLLISDRPGLGQSYRLTLFDIRDRRSRIVLTPPRGAVGDLRPLASRDGETVYFLRYPTVASVELHQLDLSSGETRRLSAGAQINGFALGPGGSLILSARQSDESYALWQLHLGSGRWVRLGPGNASDLTGSVDGRQFVFSRPERQTVLWRLPLAGDDPGQAIAASTRSDWSPVLSPDRRRLAFLSDRSGAQEVWLLDLRDNQLRRLTTFGGPPLQDLSWSPDSSIIATSVPRGGQFDIMLVDTASGRVRPVARTRMDERHAAFTTDGSGLLFVRRSGREFELRRLDFASDRDAKVMNRVMRLVPPTKAGSILFTRPFESGIWRAVAGSSGKIAAFPNIVRMRDIALSHEAIWSVDGPDSAPWLIRIDPGTLEPRRVRQLPDMARPSGIAIVGDSVVYARTLRAEADLYALRLKD